jgi:hypothetical protein
MLKMQMVFGIASALALIVGTTHMCTAEDQVYKGVGAPGEMPIKGGLTAKDFGKDQVHETKEYWGWHRGAGRGGENKGGDFNVPNDRVLVGWEAHILSEHRTKGRIDWKVICEEGRGGVLIPKGLHTGRRLEPGKNRNDFRVLEETVKNLGNPADWTADDLKKLIDSGGASFHGYFILKYVTVKDWKAKWAEKNL